MPFDGIEPLEKLTEWSFGNEKLAELEWLLRSDLTKIGHVWDFGQEGGKTKCGSIGCAMGLASAVGLAGCVPWADLSKVDGSAIARMFCLNCNGHAIGYGGVPASQVTPLMVADAIRKYMLTGVV